MKSLDQALKDQMNEYPNRGIKLTPEKTPEVKSQEEETTRLEDARYKEGKRQQRMGQLKKAVGMKSGGKVSSASKRADGCAIKGKTKGRMM